MSLPLHRISSLPLALIVAGLVGCSNSAVNEVKGTKVDSGGEYGIGEVLGNKQSCEKLEWSNAKNQNDRDVVTADCYRTINSALVEKMVSARSQAFKQRRDSDHELTVKNLVRAKEHFAATEAATSGTELHEAQQAVEALGPTVAELLAEYNKLQYQSTQARHPRNMELAEEAGKVLKELAPMQEELKRHEAVIAKASVAQSLSRSITSSYGTEITPDEVKLYEAKTAEYNDSVAKQTADGVAQFEKLGKDLASLKYGLTLDFEVLKSSKPNITKAVYFIDGKDKPTRLIFLAQLLREPAMFAKGMDDAGQIILKQRLDALESNLPNRMTVKCFGGNKDFC